MPTIQSKLDGLHLLCKDGQFTEYPNIWEIGSMYVLPTATDTRLGGIKVGSNLTVTAEGVLSAVDQSYTLPRAQNGVLGGVQVAGRFSTSNTGVLNYEDRNPCITYDDQAGSTITLDLNCNTYIREITSNTAFNFVATALEGMSSFQFYRFELIVKTGAALYTVSFPNTVTWVTDAPVFTSTNHCWRIVFESADYGQTWIASLNADYDVSEDE